MDVSQNTYRNFTIEKKISIFKARFRGLPNAYGTYDPKSGRAWQEKAHVTEEVIRDHIFGIKPLGLYLLAGNITYTAVVDFDYQDIRPALEIVGRLKGHGILSYIEASKSKGHHVWTFFDKPGVPAAKIRLLLRHELGAIGCSKVEVFPKQDFVDFTRAQYGNFINLPLFGALTPRKRTVFLDPDHNLKPFDDQWQFLTEVRTASESTLDEAVDKLDADLPQARRPPKALPSEPRVHTWGLTPCIQRILELGVDENQRVTCFHIARGLKRAGIPRQSATALLMDWRALNRPQNGKGVLSEEEVRNQTGFAYANEYPGHGCEDPTLETFCSSTCRIYPYTARARTETKPPTLPHRRSKANNKMKGDGIMGFKATMKESTIIPEGEFDAVVTGVESKEGKFGDMTQFEFELAGDEVGGKRITGIASGDLDTKSKLGRWVGTLLGSMPEVGDDVTDRLLIDKACRVVVSHRSNGDGQTFANVTEISTATVE